MVLDIFTPLVDTLKKDISNGDIDKYNPVLINNLTFAPNFAGKILKTPICKR